MNKFIRKLLVLSLSFILLFVAVDRGSVFANEQTIPTINENETQSSDNETSNDLDTKEKSETNKDIQSALSNPVDNLISRATGINVTATAPATFQTYTDPVTGLSPSELNVALALSISQADIEGAYIELPYDGFMPILGDNVYANFEMNEDIFSLEMPAAPAADSIIKSFENDNINHKLIIKLKKTITTVETLNLKFKFNVDYYGKIPSGQIIWNNAKAIVKESNGTVISTSNLVTVKAQEFSGDLSVVFSSTNTNISSNVATTSMGFYNQARTKSLLDENHDNYFFVDIPTNFEFSPKGFFGDVSKVEIENNANYTRYKVKFSDSSISFPTNWSDKIGGTYGLSATLSGFDNIAVGESVDFKIGITFKKVNSLEKTNEKTLTFTKTDLDDWGIKTSLTHSTGSTSQSVIDSTITNSPGRMVTVGGSVYSTMIRNIGQNDVKNFNVTLAQKELGSAKVSFSSLTIRNVAETAGLPLTKYKVKYEIVNALNSNTREEESGLYSGTQSMTLPNLSNGEYINKIILIPMGLSGTEEGHLPSRNGLAISYLTKNWGTLSWPDNTAIIQNKMYKVTMGVTTYYLDESDAINPQSKQVVGQDNTHYYTPSTAVDAYAYMVSSNATSKVPGDTINYELQGYTGKDSIANEWKSPEITVAIPKILELQHNTLKADYIDSVNTKTYSNAVDIALLSSDANYNYYRFNTKQDAFKITNAVSFKIPLKFKVADGSQQGSYIIPAITVSGDNFVQVSKDINNLNDASMYGYDNATNRYTAITTGHMPTTIASLTKLNGGTASRALSIDSWTTATYFGVKKNTNPQMKSEIKNVGNTTFTNVRVYNVLPYNGDARGSSGNVTFTGLNGAGTVYYTTKPVATLPSYDGLDLQTWTNSTLTANGFSTTVPADLTTVTAIYINYGNLEVNPLDSLETILNFKIPNADDQVAVNQFIYSAKEKGTTTQLNAKSEAVTFSTEIGQVIFHENTPNTTGGSVTNMPSPVSQTVVLDTLKKGNIILSSTVPTLAGYTFEYWEDEVNSKTYNPGDTINFDKNVNSNTLLNLKAKWTANSYEIAFNKNEGTGNMASQDMIYDTSASLEKNVYTRPGYRFVEWNTKADGTGTRYADEVSVNNLVSNGTFTLFAQWKANAYTVEFDKNTGTGTIANQSFVYDVEQVLTTNSYTKVGYSFVGWNTKANGTGTNYANSASVKNLATEGTTTLYAKWKANTYTVTFDKNTGTGSMSDQPFTYDVEQALTTNTLTKDGYTFVGWNTKANGTGTNYANGVNVKNLETQGAITLYAKWEANVYTVAFDKNTGTGSMSSQSFTYDVEQALALNTFIKDGYTFVGWNTKANGTGTNYANSASVKNLAAIGTTTLYAKWEANTYTVAYDKNTGTGSMADQPFIYDVEQALTTNTLMKDGYTFVGWNTKANGTGTNYTNKTSVKNLATTGTVTLYAKWEANIYTVTFDKNTGTGSMSSQSFTYDVEQALTTNTLIKDGYTFVGWNTKANGTGTNYANSASVKNLATEGVITLYAKWEVSTYTIIFDKNTGTGSMANQVFTYDVEQALAINTFVKDGNTFAGWNTERDGTGINYTNNLNVKNLTTTGSITLYAKWTANTYNVSYELDGGINHIDNPVNYTYGVEVELKEPSKEGHSFLGWEDATGIHTIKILDTDLGDKAFTAKWKANTYNIKYELDGGINHPDNPANYTYGVAIELKAPSKEGYKFLGWDVSTAEALRNFNLFASRNTESANSISITDFGNKILTAKWEKNKDEVITLIPVVDPDGSSVIEKEIQTEDVTNIITYSVLFTTTLSALGFISFKKRNKFK